MNRKTEHSSRARGKLKIGDDWNAITIIALSQTSPLKAIAELVENSIDAKARTVTITRGREHRRHFLSIRDDGEGVPRDNAGRPDFRYVATHVCDSVKRRLKADGTSGLQGEFGIGLLSFWTVGDELSITSTGDDRRAYQMVMRKGDPTYVVTPMRALFGDGGTEVRIAPLLDGIRGLSGEKIQWYLAAELRDRIRQTGVRINVVDRLARKHVAHAHASTDVSPIARCLRYSLQTGLGRASPWCREDERQVFLMETRRVSRGDWRIWNGDQEGCVMADYRVQFTTSSRHPRRDVTGFQVLVSDSGREFRTQYRRSAA
jgi:hypothetical protein